MTAPSPSLEDRLRATLAAEADRHHPAPDFAALRGDADRTLVDLRLAPRRNRARVLAAAAVLAVVALALGALVTRAGTGSGERDEPVIADTTPTPSVPTATTDPPPATPTGWYLPVEGWEITSVDPVELQVRPGLVREVLFMAPEVDLPQASVEIWRSTDPTLAAAVVPGGGTPMVRGAGAEAREVRVGSIGTSVHVAVARDDLVLHIAGHEMTEADVLALADTWWESGGTSLPTPEGQDRIGDDTYPDTPTVTTDEVVAQWGASDRTTRTAVGVSVRDAEGRTAYYELRPPDLVRNPTGVSGANDAADHGLAPDEVPDLVAPFGAGEAWLRYEGAITGHLPGTELMVTGDGEAVTRELLVALRQVTAETWQEALAAAGVEVAGVLAAPTLGGDPAADAPSDEDAAAEAAVVDRVEATLLAVATGEPPTVTDGFADEVTIGFMGDHDADVVLAGEELGDRDRWVLDLAGRWDRDGSVSALDLLADADGRVSGGFLQVPVLTCSGTEAARDPGYRAVSLVPQATGCDVWFSVVAHLDDQDRITEVRVVLEDRLPG